MLRRAYQIVGPASSPPHAPRIQDASPRIGRRLHGCCAPAGARMATPVPRRSQRVNVGRVRPLKRLGLSPAVEVDDLRGRWAGRRGATRRLWCRRTGNRHACSTSSGRPSNSAAFALGTQVHGGSARKPRPRRPQRELKRPHRREDRAVAAGEVGVVRLFRPASGNARDDVYRHARSSPLHQEQGRGVHAARLCGAGVRQALTESRLARGAGRFPRARAPSGRRLQPRSNASPGSCRRSAPAAPWRMQSRITSRSTGRS